MRGVGAYAKRIKNLNEMIRPDGSLAARIEKLLPAEREIYEKWLIEKEIWHRGFITPEGAYEAILNGNNGPKLSKAIADKLYKAQSILTVDDDASEIYAKIIEDMK